MHDERTFSIRRALPLALCLGACTGMILDPGGERRPDEPGSRPDDEDPPGGSPNTPPSVGELVGMCVAEERGLSERTMRRLTSPELRSTLEEIFGGLVAEPEIATALVALPSESLVTSESPFDNRIHDVESLESVGAAIADAVLTTPERTRAALDCEVSDLSSCQTNLVERLARRLFRRPLSADERMSYQAFMDDVGGVDGLRWAIVRAIVSPHFHQALELEGEPLGARRRISQLATASRLSLALTATLPDAELLEAAEANALGDLAALRVHATRLMQTERAKAWIHEALRRWVGASAADPSPITAAAAGFQAPGFGAEADEELSRFIDLVVFEERGTLVDLLGDDRVFPFTPRLAAVFATSPSEAAVAVPGVPRGLFLRPVSLATRQPMTSPIIRGATLRRRLLCERFPTPDPAVVAAGLAVIEGLSPVEHTSRERAEQATGGPGCRTCHASINAMGFGLQQLGPLGEWRTVETIYDAAGTEIAAHPIDASVSGLGLEGTSAVADTAELVTTLAESKEARHCFAQHVFMAQRHRLPVSEDGCLVTELVAALEGGASIVDAVIAAVVNDDIFYRAEPTP